MLDLSFLVPKKTEPWYELELHQLKDLQAGRRDAHIRSMLHSQQHDYGKRLRLVVDIDAFKITPKGSTWALDDVPLTSVAASVPHEVVFRSKHRAEEFVAKSPERPTGWQPRQGLVTDQVAAHAEPVKTAKSGRAWNWEDE